MIKPTELVYTFCPEIRFLDGKRYCVPYQGVVNCSGTIVSTFEVKNMCNFHGRTVETIFRDLNPNPISLSEAKAKYQKPKIVEQTISRPKKEPRKQPIHIEIKYSIKKLKFDKRRGIMGKVLRAMVEGRKTLSNRRFIDIKRLDELPGIKISDVESRYSYLSNALNTEYHAGVLWKAMTSKWHVLYSVNDLGLPPLMDAVVKLEIDKKRSFANPCLVDADGNITKNLWLEEAIKKLYEA